MLLEKKNAVIYGAGGAVGSAIARAFAREGARVFLTGRTRASLDAVAQEIVALGGQVETAQVDALDEQAVEQHADDVAREAGGIDVSINAIRIAEPGIYGRTGTPGHPSCLLTIECHPRDDRDSRGVHLSRQSHGPYT